MKTTQNQRNNTSKPIHIIQNIKSNQTEKATTATQNRVITRLQLGSHSKNPGKKRSYELMPINKTMSSPQPKDDKSFF